VYPQEEAAAEEVVVVDQRPGTDNKGRCTYHRDSFGSAYFAFKVYIPSVEHLICPKRGIISLSVIQ
jgi:hypothetical protein